MRVGRGRCFFRVMRRIWFYFVLRIREGRRCLFFVFRIVSREGSLFGFIVEEIKF